MVGRVWRGYKKHREGDRSGQPGLGREGSKDSGRQGAWFTQVAPNREVERPGKICRSTGDFYYLLPGFLYLLDLL